LIGAKPRASEAAPAIAKLLSLIMTNSHFSGADELRCPQSGRIAVSAEFI
jgi:hypothetical protein